MKRRFANTHNLTPLFGVQDKHLSASRLRPIRLAPNAAQVKEETECWLLLPSFALTPYAPLLLHLTKKSSPRLIACPRDRVSDKIREKVDASGSRSLWTHC
jgi:hypothetical protein